MYRNMLDMIMKQDRVSGAAELEDKIIDYLVQGGEDDVFERCLSVLSTYPSMASIWNIANLAFLYGEGARKEFDDMRKANEKVVENGTGAVENNSTILTYSRSSTVMKILGACTGEGITVICSESRPKYEGRKLALELSERGFEVLLTTDAALASMVDEADMVMIGADAILGKGIVNKAGTSPLLTYANGKGKEIYIAASSYKAFPFVFIKEEGGKEVWKNAPEGVKIKNFYFDFTDIGNISYFITENGISGNKPIFARKLSNDILEIKSMLEADEKYRLVGQTNSGNQQGVKI